MQRYNIAFLPVDPEVQMAMSALAAKHFGNIHDNYLLGKQAFAHVTVCHFRCEGEARALEAFESFPEKRGMKLKIEKFQVRPGTQINPGKYIAEFLMQTTDELLTYRDACKAHLAKCGVNVLAASDAYSPHMTLARLSSKPVRAFEITAPFGTIAFRPALGIGTESGVFVKEISG